MKSIAVKFVCSGVITATALCAAISSQADEKAEHAPGAVFLIDNSIAGNHVLSYGRSADGELLAAGLFATGGQGTGAGLGSQGSVVLSANGHWLFACNAGSDEISVFAVGRNTMVLLDKISSQGRRPISLALHRNLLFVLNAGGGAGAQDNIAGFTFADGQL